MRTAQLLLVAGHAHPDTAATRARLDEHRIADARRGADGFLDVTERIRPGDDRDARVAHALARGDLLAHRRHRVGRRSHEDDAAFRARSCELLVLAEEPVARMDRLRAGRPRRLDDAVDHQVRLRRRSGADLHRFVGEQHERGGAVRLAVHGNGSHARGRGIRG